MKKLLQSSIIYFFCISTSFAQTEATHISREDSSNIQWTSGTHHDFGEVKQGEPVSFTFEFMNAGKEALVITRGIVSCSCLSIAYTKDSVMSGNKGVIKIGYNAHTASRFSKSAEVIFNDHERVTLLITGEVIQ